MAPLQKMLRGAEKALESKLKQGRADHFTSRVDIYPSSILIPLSLSRNECHTSFIRDDPMQPRVAHKHTQTACSRCDII